MKLLNVTVSMSSFSAKDTKVFLKNTRSLVSEKFTSKKLLYILFFKFKNRGLLDR